MNNFLKSGFSLKPPSGQGFFSNKRTVCVKHQDGHISEHHDIIDPWKYISKVKKTVNIIDAWIKNE
jgi:hypothetical protein